MTQGGMMVTPKADGVDHLNIYSRARTAEGKLLSPFARAPFVLDGMRFESLEGFYHTLLFDDPEIRTRLAGMWGAAAKSWGKVTPKRPGDPIHTWGGRTVPFKSVEFHVEVCRAVRAKVEQNAPVLEALVATEHLPLTHYYVMMGKPILPRGEGTWLQDFHRDLRNELGTEAVMARLLGPLATASVRRLLADVMGGTERQRLHALRALAFRADRGDERVLETLAGLLPGAAAPLCQRLLRTLVQLELDADRAVSLYRAALDHADLVVRLVAAHKLGELGPEAHGALDRLRQAAEGDVDRLVRTFAQQAAERVAAAPVGCA
jgi:hypothetical protein